MKDFGVVGLGRMGGGLGWQAMGKGYKVVGIDLHDPTPDLVERGIVFSTDLSALQQLASPRVIFLYIHAGPALDQMIARLLPILSPGDIIVDGGNSYWGDSIRRAEKLHAEGGVHLVDLGTSGGVEGARNGACFMVGGHDDALDAIEPILLDLAQPGGYVRCGGPGSGHYVKLVHNGIEFGMLQAIGEGMNLLENFDLKLPLPEILSCWQNGSVIRSWLIDLMKEQYALQGGMTVPGYIEDTGEVNWLVSDAMRMEVPIPVISLSVMQLISSRDENKEWAKAIAMMRHGFGGHPFGPKPELKEDRQISRVGDIWRPTE